MERKITFGILLALLLIGMLTLAFNVQLAKPLMVPDDYLTLQKSDPAPTSYSAAFIYSTDLASAQSYESLLEAHGVAVDLVPNSTAETWNYNGYGLIIIGSDTWGGIPYQWKPESAVPAINDTGKPILGLGFGGSCFFGKLGLFIDWGQGWIGSKTSIYVVNTAHQIFNYPTTISIPLDRIIQLYTSTAHIGIYMPSPVAGVTPLGRESNDVNHYPLIQEDVRYVLWGFTNSPAGMTQTGKNLFVNVVLWLLGWTSARAHAHLLAIYGKAYLENVSGLLVLHVKGSPYEMGYQNGFLLKVAIKPMIQYVIQSMISKGYSYSYQVKCSQAMEPHIPEEYVQEMHGLADGACVNYTDVLILQSYMDTEWYGKGWTGGCSGFAVFGNATIDHHLYHGMDADTAHLPLQPCGLVTVYEPESGNAFVSVGFFGWIGVLNGMNKEGISVGTMGSRSSDKTLDGMPFRFLLRQVLQYSNNLTEAINIINQTDRTTGWNFLLGDGSNLNACAVETSDHYCKVFWAGDPAEDISPHYSIEDAVRRANHYVNPVLAATQRDPYDPRTVYWNWSWNRYEKLGQLILGNYNNIDAEMAIQFLKTYPVAGWSEPNIQSMVFDSTNLELWVANANSTTPAYLREYVHLSSTDLFPTSVSWEVPYTSSYVGLNYTTSYKDRDPVPHKFSHSSTANYTFSSPDANGVVNLTIPKESMSRQSWYDPTSNCTTETIPISDAYGKLYTLNNTGDVDITSMTNDTGMFFWKYGAWHPAGEEWIGDGTPDPAGSSWITGTYNVSTYWGNGTSGFLLGRSSQQSWLTTGFSQNTVIEPASRLNGFYINAKGVPYSRSGPGVVTYVLTQAGLNNPFYGGPLDVQAKQVITSAPRPALIVTTFPSPSLYITDPSNRHIGTDPITGELVNEIPGAFYSGPGSEPQRIVIPDPLNSVYDIKMIGTSTETYNLVVELATLEKTFTHTYTSNVSVGQVLESQATLSGGEMTSTSPNPGPGDANSDGHVNLNDLSMLADHWFNTPTYDSRVDFDKNGFINLSDISILADHWFKGPLDH